MILKQNERVIFDKFGVMLRLELCKDEPDQELVKTIKDVIAAVKRQRQTSGRPCKRCPMTSRTQSLP